MKGAPVCTSHGGAAPRVKAKAQQRLAEEKAHRKLVRINAEKGPAEPVVNPLLELSKLAGEATRWKEVIAGLVNQLDEIRYTGASGEQVRAEIILFERALDRCAHILIAIVRLNIDERLITIEEEQGRMLAEVVTTVLERLGLAEKSATARLMIAEELRRLEPAS